jgi:hypothetical protein
MPLAEILRHLQARPFVPFRLRLSNGEQYDILHPELLMPGRSVLYVGIPDDPREPVAARLATLGLIHIVELIPLAPGLVA